jgi:hypothetical protein
MGSGTNLRDLNMGALAPYDGRQAGGWPSLSWGDAGARCAFRRRPAKTTEGPLGRTTAHENIPAVGRRWIGLQRGAEFSGGHLAQDAGQGRPPQLDALGADSDLAVEAGWQRSTSTPFVSESLVLKRIAAPTPQRILLRNLSSGGAVPASTSRPVYLALS